MYNIFSRVHEGKPWFKQKTGSQFIGYPFMFRNKTLILFGGLKFPARRRRRILSAAIQARRASANRRSL